MNSTNMNQTVGGGGLSSYKNASPRVAAKNLKKQIDLRTPADRYSSAVVSRLAGDDFDDLDENDDDDCSRSNDLAYLGKLNEQIMM